LSQRRARRAGGLALVAWAALLLACTSAPAPPSGTGLSPYWARFDAPAERGQVVRVIDGDTFVAVVRGRTQTIRLFGVDTPERDDRCYDEARDQLAVWLPVGEDVWLQPGPRNDDGTRLLRYVFTASGAVLTDAALVQAGLGEAWRRDGPLRNDIVGLEETARAARRGCLWE